MRSPRSFSELQRDYFDVSDKARLDWTTQAPGIAETEDELLAPLLERIESPCLEIGCGEGNNLVRLSRRVRCVGVDLYRTKLRLAADELAHVPLGVADATALPFAAAAFRSVFIRDLLHHVSEPALVLAEAVRVLAPGGRLCVLEPNGGNPIVRLQTWLIPAEAGARHSNPGHIGRLLAGLPVRELEIATSQPLPLRRMLLHYRLGLPALGRMGPIRRFITALEGGLGAMIPPSRWCYVVATALRL
jgi:SAM-dependent methyltransferase